MIEYRGVQRWVKGVGQGVGRSGHGCAHVGGFMGMFGGGFGMAWPITLEGMSLSKYIKSYRSYHG